MLFVLIGGVGAALAIGLWLLVPKSETSKTNHPHFAVRQSGFELIPHATDQEAKPLWVMRVRLENVADHPAKRIRGYFIAADSDLNKSPFILERIDTFAEVNKGDPFSVNSSTTWHEVGGGALFIACGLAYDDSVTGNSYSQEWYWQWPGSQGGTFPLAFFHVNSAEAERMKTYTVAQGLKSPPD